MEQQSTDYGLLASMPEEEGEDEEREESWDSLRRAFIQSGIMEYRVDFSPDARQHLAELRAADRAVIDDEIVRQLLHEPAAETLNRKPMRTNDWASWELRIGRFRVYYDVEDEPESVVYIRAIGIKERNKVRIENRIVEL